MYGHMYECMYLYICMYADMYTCMYIHILHTYMKKCVCIYAYMYTCWSCMAIFVCMYSIYTHIKHTYVVTHECMYVHSYLCLFTYAIWMYTFRYVYWQTYIPSWDSSVGRAADCHATGPGFNTHSKPGWELTQLPSLCG